MKRLIGSLVVFLVLLMAVSAMAQYTVSPGDTGWELARQYYRDATVWQRIVDMNPFLQESGRVFEKGDKIILLLKPGEQLAGLERLGVQAPTAIPISQLTTSTLPAVQVVEVKAPTPWWAWVLYVLGGLFVVVAVLLVLLFFKDEKDRKAREQAADQEREKREIRLNELQAEEQRRVAEELEQELNSDPVTSGQPYVPGGIAPTETERLREFFMAQAVESYADRTGELPYSVRVEQIGPIESGLIHGEGEVGYLDDRGFRPRRIPEPGIPAYQARFRFSDGTEMVLQSLAACMNPVRGNYGETYRGFTFTPTATAVPEPVAAPVATDTPSPEPAAGAADTANVVRLETAVPTADAPRTEDGMVRIEVRQRKLDQPAMVRMSGVDDNSDMTVEVGNNTFMVRFLPRS